MNRPNADLKRKLSGKAAALKNLEKLQLLLDKLEEREISLGVQEKINKQIDELNATDKKFVKAIEIAFSQIINLLEKELKLVPKNHYTTTWLALGMTIFGLPIGVVFGSSLGNIGLMAIGLPIGMAIGMGVGKSLDDKAAREGRVLDVE